MVKHVVATERGYFGGKIQEEGDSFTVPDDIWNDPALRPRWAKLDPKHAFGGKGDHDGDGSVGGRKSGSAAAASASTALASGTVAGQGGSAGGDAGGNGPVIVPADWQSFKPADRKALASKIAGREITKAPEADKLISEYVEATKPAPFSDAPPPGVAGKPKGNGVTEALGGPAPDWIDHSTAGGEGGSTGEGGSGNPEQVDD